MHGKIYRKWKRLLAEFWTSHLTLAEYCRLHNLNPKCAGRWKNIFLKERCRRIDCPAELEIVPVNLHEAESVCKTRSSGVRLELGELRIELQTDFDMQTLKDVLSLLGVR